MTLFDVFSAAMDRLGPFEPEPRLAAGVSGGADSMALMLLAREWVQTRGGTLLALTVDHGLRPESATEASLVHSWAEAAGIETRVLRATGLHPGPALAERARAVRYRLLTQACAEAGVAHLVLGHHRGDQVETVMMRALSGSASRGLAGMAAVAETAFVRLLRPMLTVPPEQLRAFLRSGGIAWIEDPSNQDRRALRTRLRLARADPDGTGIGTQVVAAAARAAGQQRSRQDEAVAKILAERVAIHPEGYAVLSPGLIEPRALAAVMRMIAGRPFAPPMNRVAALARTMGPATLGGVRIVPAGRLGPGWLLVREARAMDGPVAVCPGAVWDGRFRIVQAAQDTYQDTYMDGALMAALGEASAEYRDRRGPPAVILRTLPAIRRHGRVIGVPHLGIGDGHWVVLFHPFNRAACAPFEVG